MLLTSQLAEELGVTSQTIRDHAKKCGVGKRHELLNAFVFTEVEADKVRRSVHTAKRGRPKGAKNKPKAEAR